MVQQDAPATNYRHSTCGEPVFETHHPLLQHLQTLLFSEPFLFRAVTAFTVNRFFEAFGDRFHTSAFVGEFVDVVQFLTFPHVSAAAGDRPQPTETNTAESTTVYVQHDPYVSVLYLTRIVPLISF